MTIRGAQAQSDGDRLTVDESRVRFDRGPVYDLSKLRIRDGVIHYRIYRQDGSMQDMTCPDTHANRFVVDWIQSHDRMGGAS